MAPKKVLANLKAREAELASRYTKKRKRAEDPAARAAEFNLLKKGTLDQPAAKAIEVAAKPTPEDIPLSDVWQGPPPWGHPVVRESFS